MKDEHTIEILSRLVDEDTTSPETEAARTLVSEDSDAESTFDEFRRNRQLLRSYALADEPPAVLDDLVVELRRQGRPSPRSWLIPVLAAAALIVICFAAVLEMKRHSLPDELLEGRSVTPAPVFALSALPEAKDDSPLGPLEELLASPYPPPALLEAEPLVVLGPLPEPPPQ